MTLAKETIEKIELALTFIGKTVYASEHNYKGEFLPSVIDAVEINKMDNDVVVYLTDVDNDCGIWIDIDDYNVDWFMTKKELREYWESGG